MHNYNKTSEELNTGGFDFLIKDDYHYIKIGATTVAQLKQAGIFPNKSYNGLTQNKPDGIILKGKNTIKVLVEYKKDGKIKNEKEALSVLTEWYFKLAKALNCRILCASDGINTFWFNDNKQIIKNSNNEIIRNELKISKITENKLTEEENLELVTLLEKMENLDIDAKLKPESILNPQTLANKVWQKIWINTGKEPEKCLYNVVEIFIFKFLSDLGILQDTMSFAHIYEISINDKERALKSYANNIRKDIKEDMFPPSQTDGTTIFNGTIFVNEEGKPNLAQAGLFAQVLKEFADYEKEYGSFKNIDKQFKTRLYESFLRQSAGISALGQYFTPRNVVVSIINMINPDSISENAKICDPFCGVGGFLLELLNQMPKLKNNYKPYNGKINPKMELIGYDKGTDEKDDERTIILAKANMLIYFSDLVAKYKDCMSEFSNKVFNKVFHLVKTNLGTFGIKEHKDHFDLILTNPPYVTSGVSSIKKAIAESGLSNMYPSMGNGLEGLAIEWIINALKPDGQAYIVVPDGVLSRQGDNKLREAILDNCYLNAVISLPTRTFFATPKKTYILALKKKSKKEKQTMPVFTYLISEIGETRDAKRFETPEKNDLVTMSKTFRQFMSMPNDFECSNIRCKVQNIDRFIDNHWLVDRDWSDDDKKDLGIAEESTEMSEDEFYSFLSDISISTKAFAKEENKNQARQNVNYKEIQLGQIIDFEKSTTNPSSFTKKFIFENKGNIPVFGASKYSDIPSYGYIKDNIDGIKYFEDCLTWNIDGSIGCFYRNGRFSLSEKVIPLYLYPEYNKQIDLNYLANTLIQKANEYGFSREYKPNQSKLKEVLIEIPINSDGTFDIKKQQEIAKKYKEVGNKQKQIIDMLKQIQEAQIKIC